MVKLKINNNLLDNFGELFHTVLRKGMDSHYSVILWQSICNMDENIWAEFVNYVVSRFKEIKYKEISVNRLEHIFNDWHHDVILQKWFHSKNPEEQDSYKNANRVKVKGYMIIFTSAIHMFPIIELENMIETLNLWSNIE